jgi:hypothetical protein
MRARLSRSWILITVALLILIAALPSEIQRLVRTGDPYLFTRHFFADMVARLSGPGRLRFILQPIVAILVGMRDGKRDARTGSPPFLLALVSRRALRRTLLWGALASIRDLVAIAIILDVICQFLIFREIHPGAALLLGPLLIAVPYASSRAVANRLSRRHVLPTPVIH